MTDTNQPDLMPVIEIDPTDILTERVVNLLTPAFLAPAKGNEDLARAAAFKVLCDYYAHTPGDLLSIAQAILLGLATIEATGRSLAPGVSDATFLRLTGRANTLARSEARARKAMMEYCIPRPQPELPDWSAILEPEDETETEITAEEAVPPPQPPADAPECEPEPVHAAEDAPVTSHPRPGSLRSRALSGVCRPALIGLHPADANLPPELIAAAAASGQPWAQKKILEHQQNQPMRVGMSAAS